MSFPRTKLGLILVLASTLVLAASDDGRPKPIVGTYAVFANNVDPPPDAPRDSHFYIALEGEAAKALYDAMKVEPKFDACEEQPLKTIGGMECGFNAKSQSYHCDFAIEIATQKIEDNAC